MASLSMSKHLLSNPHNSQVLRYLAVGVCNTLVGYGCFALFTMALTPLVAYGYVLASLLANLVSITFAFLGYKWFVFKTEGNYLKEWARCVAVYSAGMVLSAAALPFVVALVRHQGASIHNSPYIAGAIVLLSSVMFSFLGHRHFSFTLTTPADETFRNCDNQNSSVRVFSSRIHECGKSTTPEPIASGYRRWKRSPDHAHK